jgi:hypothetical protein
MVKKRLVLWFRNDIHLNCIINKAVKRVKSKEFDEVGAIRQQAQLAQLRADRQREPTLLLTVLVTESRVQTSLSRVCVHAC